jgi:flagellin-like protein
MKIKRFLNNSKAISPIFATLILIAIAVIAGVVVYMFTSGTLATMTGGGTAAQEKAAVQGFSLTHVGTTWTATAYAQSTGGDAITISSMIIKDNTGATITSITPTTTALPSTGALTTLSGTSTATINVGTSYTVTLVSTKGGSFVSSATVAT